MMRLAMATPNRQFERGYAGFATLAVPAARWSLKSRATLPLVASEARADDEWRADNDGEGARPGQSCSAASSSSGRSAIISWPAPRRMMVLAFGSAAATVL